MYKVGDLVQEIEISEDIKFRVFQDNCVDSPRDWDNLGEMVCWHKRYTLGDKHEYESPEELLDEITTDGSIYLPLYLYSHSGITISTSPFSCRWDSGQQVGFIIMRLAVIDSEFGGDKDKALKCLETEVKKYDQYLRGDIYLFQLVRLVTCDHCDHCDHCDNIDENIDENIVDSC